MSSASKSLFGVVVTLAATCTSAFLSSVPPAHLGTAATTPTTIRPQPRQLRMASSSATLNDPSAKRRAVIVGGGPAGALMAVYLSRSGSFDVDVFEALEGSQISAPTTRSWNVVLFERGSHALESAGVDLQEEVRVWTHNTGRETFPAFYASRDYKQRQQMKGTSSYCLFACLHRHCYLLVL